MLSNIRFPDFPSLVVGTTMIYFGIKIGISSLKGMLILFIWHFEPEKVPVQVIQNNWSKEFVLPYVEIERVKSFWQLLVELFAAIKKRKVKV